MRTIRDPEAMTGWALETLAGGETIAFVPTMGALHEGHLSLVRYAREACDRLVTSVFVNPTQFAPSEDLESYPRDLEGDAATLRDEECDVLFAPSAEAMYEEGHVTFVVQEGGPAGPLEGAARPTHFRGVLTVVCKLFLIVRPTVAVFGQKDWQQTLVVRKMARDLSIPVEVRVRPIVREADGLARSSRNDYLSGAERDDAVCLFRALEAARAAAGGGERDPEVLVRVMEEIIGAAEHADPEYVTVRDPATLEPLEAIDEERGAMALLAVRVGEARLIDNMALVEPAGGLPGMEEA